MSENIQKNINKLQMIAVVIVEKLVVRHVDVRVYGTQVQSVNNCSDRIRGSYMTVDVYVVAFIPMRNEVEMRIILVRADRGICE